MNPELPAWLSRLPAKRAGYGADTYFLESAEQLDELTGDVAGFCFQHAVLLLKPDAVAARQLLPAIDWLTARDYRVVSARAVRLTRRAVRALWHYQWNVATAQRRWLASLFVESVDSLVLVVRAPAPAAADSGVPAAVRLTEAKGPTEPSARTAGQLRHLLGSYSYLLNLAHTADEPADVVRELGVYFDDPVREQVYREALSGADRSEVARALAGELYERIPEQDLTFAPAAARLEVALDTALAGTGLDPGVRAALADAARPEVDPRERYRRVLDLVRRDALVERLALAVWDVVVVGSSVLPLKRPDLAPVLPGVGLEEWRRALSPVP